MERVAEHGTYGAITTARKVRSFTRNLVSVSDLTDQFGVVQFDRDGVFVDSGSGNLTRIGSRTVDRLYSFDADALSRHARSLPTTFSALPLRVTG